MSFEWSSKIDDIQERLNESGMNLSSGVFVNAHRPFYSASNRFAWSSGIELPFEGDTSLVEKCVKYSSTGLQTITCDSDVEAFPLLCQRVSSRKVGTSKLKDLLAQKLNISRMILDYSAESCDYFSLVRLDYNWYQAKKFCETINSELLVIPRNEECQLVIKCLNMRVSSK